jgi:hypothetical protein
MITNHPLGDPPSSLQSTSTRSVSGYVAAEGCNPGICAMPPVGPEPLWRRWIAAMMSRCMSWGGVAVVELSERPVPVVSLPERLVNLTGHEIVLAAHEHAASDDDQGMGAPSVLHLAPAGQVARVDDSEARLGAGWLNTTDLLLRVTRLRRSRHVTGLPAPQAGTRFVVSRLTAHAARHRGDLAFPLDEVRDDQGRVIGAWGLGTYRRSLAVAERYRDWRAGAIERRSSRSLPRDWLTGVLFVAGTALLSGAMGLLPGSLDNAGKNGWAGGGQAWTAWLTVAFLAAGAVIVGVAARRWFVRQRMLDERGTAYVIEEQAIHWRHEEKRSVLAAIASGFPSVLRVPGPGELGDDWRWQADADGAPQWDMRTDQLVRSFWSVYYNDNHVTRNAVFVWAPWPVAMAFAARATARRRHGLVLHVRQRPSGGAAGPRQELRLDDAAHDFLRRKAPVPLDEVAPEHVLTRTCAQADVTIEVLTTGMELPHTHGRRRSDRNRLGSKGAARASGHVAGLLLLLVRFVAEDIGAIPVDLQEAAEIKFEVAQSLAASVLSSGSYRVPVVEWRLTASDGSHAPWQAFPVIAENIASWVEEQAAAHPDHVILLAARMPQEIALGVGIQLGQRSVRWPSWLFPVHYTGGRLVVPDLDLGRGSVAMERGPGA